MGKKKTSLKRVSKKDPRFTKFCKQKEELWEIIGLGIGGFLLCFSVLTLLFGIVGVLINEPSKAPFIMFLISFLLFIIIVCVCLAKVSYWGDLRK